MALSFCQCLLHSGNLAHASDVYVRLMYEARMPVYSFTMRNKPGNWEKNIYIYISFSSQHISLYVHYIGSQVKNQTIL